MCPRHVPCSWPVQPRAPADSPSATTGFPVAGRKPGCEMVLTVGQAPATRSIARRGERTRCHVMRTRRRARLPPCWRRAPPWRSATVTGQLKTSQACEPSARPQPYSTPTKVSRAIWPCGQKPTGPAKHLSGLKVHGLGRDRQPRLTQDFAADQWGVVGLAAGLAGRSTISARCLLLEAPPDQGRRTGHVPVNGGPATLIIAKLMAPPPPRRRPTRTGRGRSIIWRQTTFPGRTRSVRTSLDGPRR